MTRVRVRATARSSRNDIDGFDPEGVLHLRVAAAPVDGAANEAIRNLLARHLHIAPGRIDLVSGSTRRDKVFDVPVPQDELVRAFGLIQHKTN